jgi:soluble lytic murein transglycosylase-like protein
MHVSWARWSHRGPAPLPAVPPHGRPAPGTGWPAHRPTVAPWRPVAIRPPVPAPGAGWGPPRAVRRRPLTWWRQVAEAVPPVAVAAGLAAAGWWLALVGPWPVRPAAAIAGDATAGRPVPAGTWQAAAPAGALLPGGPGPVAPSSVSAGTLRAALAEAARSAHPSAPPTRPYWWTPAIGAAAQRTGLPAALLAAVAQVESAGDPGAVSPAGAVGLMQLLPATAAALGVRDLLDPLDNATGGARYLATWLRAFSGGDPHCVADPSACPTALRLALAAYNAGPGAVRRYGGVPPYPETQRYIQEVLALYARYAAAPD